MRWCQWKHALLSNYIPHANLGTKFDTSTIHSQLCSSVGTRIILCLGVELRTCIGSSSKGYTRRKLALGEEGPLVLKVFGPSVVLPPSWMVIPGLGSMVSTWRGVTGERERGVNWLISMWSFYQQLLGGDRDQEIFYQWHLFTLHMYTDYEKWNLCTISQPWIHIILQVLVCT